MAARKAKTKAAPKPHIRKPIVDVINELKSWLPNYDHNQGYPLLLISILAGLPGGEYLEDVGYEPVKDLGWHELDQLARVLSAIENKEDVQAIVREVYESDDPEEVVGEPEAPPPPPQPSEHRHRRSPFSPRARRASRRGR